MIEKTLTPKVQKRKAIYSLLDKLGGDEVIQVGIYDSPHQDMATAHQNTILKLVKLLPSIKKKHRILILGSGYGNAARCLAQEFNCKIDAVNPYKIQNQKNEMLTGAANLDDKVSIHKGGFRHLAFERETFDIVWSQDDLSLSSNKPKIFREVKRVLKTSGRFIFTGYLSKGNLPKENILDLADKVQVKELGSLKMYKRLVSRVGLERVYIKEFPSSLEFHTTNVLQKMNNLDKKTIKEIDKETIVNEKEKYNQRLAAIEKGLISWGIFQFQKLND
jgi:ubiquinone/menaquinone biosynthesis C-methylase UbiE